MPDSLPFAQPTDPAFDGEGLLAHLIDLCLRAGASAADGRVGVAESLSVDVREGRLESLERSETAGIALRVFFGQRHAHVSGQDVTAEGLDRLAQRCVAMARAAPEDRFAGLPDAAELARDWPALDLSGDPDLSPEALEADALEAEAAALAVPGVKQVMGSGAGWSRSRTWLGASNGFTALRSGGYGSLGLAALAEQDGKMERDHEGWSVRRRADRPAADTIGRIAGERAVARLGARKIDSQRASVIFDRRVSASLLSAFISAISGPAVARGVSFLKDRLGARVFAPGIRVIDDPFRPRGLGSRAFDGEGRPVRETALVDDGILTAFLLNTPSARQLGMTPNGFASTGFGDPPGVSTSNLHLVPGPTDPAQAVREAGEGLLITDMFGPSINANTGDYSVGVAGFWFANGAIQHPVSEVTVAGNLPDMFARLVPLSDLEFRGSMNAPSILIADLQLAGK
jgi:PmbA protein